MRVPLGRVDVDAALEERILRVVRSGTYILGPECRAFEAELARWLGRREVVLVSNATSAATLALLALGIGAGDEVLVPSHTAFPTVESILDAAATPVFAEIDAETLTVDPRDLAARATSRTRAIVPVHLYGHPCDMDPILALARERDIVLLEDCAQAHGARYKGALAGTLGRAAVFSFYPSKNLPVLGDGGALATDDPALAERVRMLRDHGRRTKHAHEVVGFNMRFNEIQAASGRFALERLDAANERRRAAATRYAARLAGTPGLALPVERPWARSVYHLFVVRVLGGPAARDALARALEERGIQTGVHYPVPNHLQPAVLGDPRARRASLPRTEAAAGEVLSLPMFPSITEAEIDHVCEAVRNRMS